MTCWLWVEDAFLNENAKGFASVQGATSWPRFGPRYGWIPIALSWHCPHDD